MKIAVIGAGPAGLTAAYEIAKTGMEVEVFEASPHVGGMCRSFELWNQVVDLGPHRFFSSDARVNKLWLEIAEDDYRLVDRTTRIFYNNRFFDYPLQPGNALANLGPIEACRCLGSYLIQKCKAADGRDTFESWVTGRFGRRLYEIFFKTYSEKLWGIPCSQLDSDFAAQRIKKLSLGEAIKNALRVSGKKHQTLVDQFAYPTGGTGMIYERLAEYVGATGKVHLETPVKRILQEDKKITGLELVDGERRDFNHVISTMPFTTMVKGLDDVPADVRHAVEQLRFRNTILVYLNVDGVDLFPDQWIYVHASNLEVGRVTNFRNWVPDIIGSESASIIAMEYWCYEEDQRWKDSDESLIEMASKEMKATGLIGDANILDGEVVRVPKCYPVYSTGYKTHLDVVTDFVKGFSGLTPIGRYGSFKYNNQDHSILMGLLAAANITDRFEHDLWSVNTDYDTYQEETRITASGLVSVND